MSTRQARGLPGPDELARVAWHISTRSEGNGGHCVEAGPLADGTGRIAVRHSRHRDGATIVYTRKDWDAFTARVKNGDFDLGG